MTDTENTTPDLTTYAAWVRAWVRADSRARHVLDDAVDLLPAARMTGGGATPVRWKIPTTGGYLIVECDVVGVVPGWSWTRYVTTGSRSRAVGFGRVNVGGAEAWDFNGPRLAAVIEALTD